MNRQNVMDTMRTALAAALLVGVAACADSPLDSDTASSHVRFSLAGAKTAAGMDVCAETDSAALTVAPDGERVRARGLALGNSECGADFAVTVPRGRVQFTGSLHGEGRPLFRGAASHMAEEDGFVVIIDLNEIDALEVLTRTIGLGGPTEYEFQVDDGPRIPIGPDDQVTLGALAAGGRIVTLFPTPCTVVGDDSPEVPIPVDEALLGEVEFEIDCNQGGSITFIVKTGGSGGPPGYTVTIGEDTTVPLGRADSVTVVGVTPGPIELTFDVGGCAATAVPPIPFLPSGGSIRVEVDVNCTNASPPPAPPPPPPPGPGFQISSMRIVTTSPRPPGPGESTGFDYRITDGGGTLFTGSLVVGDSVLVSPLNALANPHEVELIPTGSCTVLSQNPQIVNLSASTLLRVVFSVGC